MIEPLTPLSRFRHCLTLMHFRFLLLAVLLLIGVNTPAQIKSTNGPTVRLTLEQAIVLALQNNFRIAIQRITSDLSLYDLKASYGAYDPTYSLNFVHSSQTREGQFSSNTGIQAPASTSEVDSVRQNVTGYLPTGLTYDLGVVQRHNRLAAQLLHSA